MKSNYKFRLVLSALLLIVPVIARSQDFQKSKAEFKNKLYVLFRQLDKSKITSGLLADYWRIMPWN